MIYSGKITAVVAATVAGLLSTPVRADVIQTFNLAWSGAPFGNTAMATGTITLDETLLGDPFNYAGAAGPGDPFIAVSITISGAALGNGTFGSSSFSYVALSSDGSVLNLTKQLVGQASGSGLWGEYDFNNDNYSGDFNLFANGGLAPSGTSPFELTTDDGQGSRLQLTSFTVATAVPEPSSVALLGFAALGLGVLVWRPRPT